MRFTEAEIHKMVDKLNQLRGREVTIELGIDGNGDEIAEEYEPDFDDDEFYHQMHAHRHDDFNYRPFGAGDLL